jgi:TatD DNase family protein
MVVDVHCHLTLLRQGYGGQAELDKAVESAQRAGVMMISNGTSVEDSKRAVQIAEKYPNVWACVGIHPEEISNNQIPSHKGLEGMFKHKKVVGIGEIGLNYYQGIGAEEKEKQKELFESQLQLAEKFLLPVEVHNRGADDDIFQQLSRHPKLFISGVLLHCFTRGPEFMKKMSELGAYFSFGGLIAYPNNNRMRKVAQEVPAGRLLLETDSPYSYPMYGMGEKNQPLNVKIVAKCLAEVRDTSINQIEDLTSLNAKGLFTKMT